MKRYLLIIITFLVVTPALAETPDAASLEALKQAAEQGQADAQYELGVLYEFGFRFPDYKLAAYAWYSRAAAQGNVQAAQRRDILKPKLSAAELDRAQKMAAATLAVPAPATSPKPSSSPSTTPSNSDATAPAVSAPSTAAQGEVASKVSEPATAPGTSASPAPSATSTTATPASNDSTTIEVPLPPSATPTDSSASSPGR